MADLIVSYIIHTHLNNEIETRAVDDAVLLIGRAADAQLQLWGDAVELRHARIEHGDGHYLLINESRSAGTYVNGMRTEKKIVTDGDRIAIGPFTVRAGFEPATGRLVPLGRFLRLGPRLERLSLAAAWHDRQRGVFILVHAVRQEGPDRGGQRRHPGSDQQRGMAGRAFQDRAVAARSDRRRCHRL